MKADLRPLPAQARLDPRIRGESNWRTRWLVQVRDAQGRPVSRIFSDSLRLRVASGRDLEFAGWDYLAGFVVAVILLAVAAVIMLQRSSRQKVGSLTTDSGPDDAGVDESAIDPDAYRHAGDEGGDQYEYKYDHWYGSEDRREGTSSRGDT